MTDKTAVLDRVYLAESVVQACLAHALTTEQEEVMGVLLGDIQPSSSPAGGAGRKWAHVWGAAVVQRSVRRKDRVEIAPTELAAVAAEAERRGGCVVGWYHSHPRITPYPSHVDLRSQRDYQQLESGWVGLIFSVFYTDTSQKSAVSIHCFQTGAGDSHIMVDFEIVPRLDKLSPSSLSRDLTHEMLQVFATEIEEAVELVRKRTGGAVDAVSAARALQEVQLYTMEKLIAEPALLHLQASIAYLEKKVKHLEGKLQNAQR
ncbi:Mov34/MPN/PAD-1 metallopeptidase [Trypanosoma theileri]|uniref:Mov34/MPN/PAD-1 metallopeptidase n=1 Tax=Trypanosoma theileri TaxID=67003 RepID=A0A1X0P845_9TRYP|nr:Mov34/MPN/PAD-1 metallopeptidase [Trypanosoma theileri]ORC92803.1 Mov34/MPN/PAD-1 metallopeptidase [Trypanosoma theileri]